MKIVDSPAARIERQARERGELEVVVAVAAALEAARLLAGNVHRLPWLLPPVVLLAALLHALRRRQWARRSAPQPARIRIADGRVQVEGNAARHTLTLAEPREGWATPVDHGAVVALRAEGGGLLSFLVGDPDKAAGVLAHAGAGDDELPRCFTLDRAGPWNAWLAVATRPGARRGAFALAILAGIALVAVVPEAGGLYGYALLAVGLGFRALALRHRPRVTIEPGAVVLDALAFHRRVGLARVVSVEETPGGVSLLAANGNETLLPLATRPPIRRATAKPWTSEAELRDAALARRAALARAVRAASEHRPGPQAYRAADGTDVRGAFGIR